MAIRDLLLSALLLGSVASGCKLLNTSDDENVAGRGATAFDPYRGPDSGAIRLSLQHYNGCAILPTGEPIARAKDGQGNDVLKFSFDYPGDCETKAPPGMAVTPKPMVLLTETDYFVNQLTFMESARNLHQDPTNMSAIINWIRRESVFQHLDWTGVSVNTDEWVPSDDTPNPNAFLRRVVFGGARWMQDEGGDFKVEILDFEGNVRATQTYRRKDFFVENPASRHTQFGWEHRNIGPPKFPGDLEVHPVEPASPAYPPAIPYTYSFARYDAVMSMAPHQQLRIPRGLAGFGAIKVTWSQMPAKPFFFPVEFIRPEELEKTCYVDGDENKKVACTFGLEPVATLSTPANGKFFVPGEKVSYTLGAKDGAGNYLHPKDSFPTISEAMANKANGLTYLSFPHFVELMERDISATHKVAGPIQDLDAFHEMGDSPYFEDPIDAATVIHPAAILGTVIGGMDIRPPTTTSFTLPENAKPGTYVLLWKVHRFFRGERFSRMEAFFFPVGQEERTFYPGNVGNCQICHRGQLSLENVRHGLGVDHIEACKLCHDRDSFPVARVAAQSRLIHEIHMSSNKYPLAKNDCATCHLKKSSAIRPSLGTCASCHPAPHGGKYDSLATVSDLEEGGTFGNCANSCHVTSLPKGHIYPEQ